MSIIIVRDIQTEDNKMSYLQNLSALARQKGLNFRMVDWHLEIEINNKIIVVRTVKELEDI